MSQLVDIRYIFKLLGKVFPLYKDSLIDARVLDRLAQACFNCFLTVTQSINQAVIGNSQLLFAQLQKLIKRLKLLILLDFLIVLQQVAQGLRHLFFVGLNSFFQTTVAVLSVTADLFTEARCNSAFPDVEKSKFL